MSWLPTLITETPEAGYELAIKNHIGGIFLWLIDKLPIMIALLASKTFIFLGKIILLKGNLI